MSQERYLEYLSARRLEAAQICLNSGVLTAGRSASRATRSREQCRGSQHVMTQRGCVYDEEETEGCAEEEFRDHGCLSQMRRRDKNFILVIS